MKRLLLTIVVALVVPGVAQAKELTGFSVCGPDGCAGGKLSGFGHQGPFDPAGAGHAAPPPGAFYTIRLEVDGSPDAWTVFYEPRSGLAAYRTEHAWMTWTRLDARLAGRVKDAAKQIRPFARPTVTRVRIAGREVTGDLDSYLRLFEVGGAYGLPGDGESDVINLDSAVENPWTDAQLLYYPDDDIIQISAARTIRLPADLAADIEAARPLGTDDGVPLAVLLALAAVAFIAGAAGVAIVARALRVRSRGAAGPRAEPA